MNDIKNIKAAFLVRCSTNKQDYERQIRDLQLVADRFRYQVYQIYGEHITGRDDTTKRDRLSIIRLRQDAEKGKFNVILVSEVSRMSRDSVSGRVYIRQFCNLGIPVYFRDKMKWTIDPSTMKQDGRKRVLHQKFSDGRFAQNMRTVVHNAISCCQLAIFYILNQFTTRGGTTQRLSRNNAQEKSHRPDRTPAERR